MKVAQIIGARPQFIKYLPVSIAIEKINRIAGTKIEDVLIHTGQHYDYVMSKVFFDELGIKEPDYHLQIGSGTHGEQTGRIIQKVEEVLEREEPDAVVVYGDTNTTLGGAIAAVKMHIPVAHVESGLRSNNKYMPEEINRILTDDVSTVLFCPSKTAVENLASDSSRNVVNGGRLIPLDFFKTEKIKADKNNPVVINTGDVMYDVLLYAGELAERKSTALERLGLSVKSYYLMTLHRAESTDSPDRLEELMNFVSRVSGGKTVIFPMHPRTRKLYEAAKLKFADNIRIIEPVSYFDMVLLMKNSLLILTDSGGMQKEAYWLKIPCITLREETEWVETIKNGWNVLYRDYTGPHEPVENSEPYYGDGRAAERIVSALMNVL